MDRVPDGWAIVAFEDVVEVNPRKYVDLEHDDLVTFVPMAAVSEISGTIVDGLSRPLKEVSRGFTQFNENDVLFAKITPSMENGKSAIARGLQNATGFGSTEFHVFRSYGAISSEYLWHFIRQSSFRDNAKKVMSGAVGQQRVPAQYLKSHLIPIPPLAEQGRILERVNSLISRSVRARNNLDPLPNLISYYKKRLLKQAFSGQLSAVWRTSNPNLTPVVGRSAKEMQKKFVEKANPEFVPPYDLPEHWRWLRLPEVGDLDRGKSKHRPRNDPRLLDGEYPFIQTGDVRAAKQYLTKFSNTYSEFGLKQSRLWPIGTVCITIAANIAETTILGIEACFPDSIVGFTPDEARMSSEYLEFFMRTIREDLAAFAPATAQKNINLGVLSAVRVPVPPIDEQLEIVRCIETSFKRLSSISADHELASQLLPNLEAAILKKAFAGKLSKQDNEEEPAKDLIARMRLKAETEQNQKSKKQRTSKKQKKVITMVRNLLDVLSETAEWLPAQEVFRRCGIIEGSETEAIEELYAELRILDKSGRLDVEPVYDEKGRKLYDKLKLKES